MRVPRMLLLWLPIVAACAAPRTLERAAMVPPLQYEHPQADLTRDAGMRADADRSLSLPSPPAPTESGDSTPVAFRSVVQIVEVPVANDPNSYGDGSYGNYASYTQPVTRTSAWRSRRGGWFPVGTAVGAGIGAVIGNQSGHRGRGAFIGSNVGLLFDMARWFR